MSTNHMPLDPLEAAGAALRELPAEIGPSTATLDRIATLAMNAETQSMPAMLEAPRVRIWRQSTVLLLTSAALVAAFYCLVHTPKATFAFEDVVAAVRTTDAVSYNTVLTPKNGPASQFKTYHKGSATRVVHTGGSYTVTDMARQRMLSVEPNLKRASLVHLGTKAPDAPTMGSSIMSWLKTAETSGKPVGEKVIDGVHTPGFEANFGPVTMIIWGDPKTKLPVLMESTIGAPSEPISMVMRDFVFNVPLDDALFSTEIPAGYEADETTQPTVDFAALVKLPPEEHVVRILKFYAELNDGAFPERIDGPELASKLTSSAGPKRLADPQFMKELTTLSGSMGATWTFRQTLQKFGYLGTAHLGDPVIVFWYLPSGTEKYRVVYGDLKIGDVTEDQLPTLPAK